jgi:hypothetical protein
MQHKDAARSSTAAGAPDSLMPAFEAAFEQQPHTCKSVLEALLRRLDVLQQPTQQSVTHLLKCVCRTKEWLVDFAYPRREFTSAAAAAAGAPAHSLLVSMSKQLQIANAQCGLPCMAYQAAELALLVSEVGVFASYKTLSSSSSSLLAVIQRLGCGCVAEASCSLQISCSRKIVMQMQQRSKAVLMSCHS